MTKVHKLEKRPIVLITVSLLLIFYGIFFIIPIVYGLIGSFFNWNPMTNTFIFNGLKNYKSILTDPILWRSLLNTLVFTIAVVVMRTILGLLIAVGIFFLPKFKSFFRTTLFLPVITSIVAVSLVWKWLYDPLYGSINYILSFFSLPAVNWLQDKNTVLISIIIMTLWKDLGYAIVLYLAGLSGIPRTYFEAAEIDGASGFRKLWNITIPSLNGTTLFVLTTSIISYLQTFTQIFIMTKGGPGTASYTIAYLIYDDAFNKYDFGTASAMSFVLFIITLVISLGQFKITNYDGGN